jgi:hypothetical protein
MAEQKKNGPFNLKAFSDVLREKMRDEIAEQKKVKGPFTTYRKILEDALTKRYAEKTARERADEQRVTEEIAEKADVDLEFLGDL